MVALTLLAVLIAIPVVLYRLVKKHGVSVLWFVAAAVSFLDASGVLAEKLWGPQWAWNFSHHHLQQATASATFGIFYLALALYSRTESR